MKQFLSTTAGKVLAFFVILLVVALIVAWILLDDVEDGRLLNSISNLSGLTLLVLLVTVVLWISIDLGLRYWKKRRQERFDAQVAAKEGIDDRRREWTNWTAELRKQGIDRYELPMFMLVGEPQSGKSVMLQNSDLHFPFGQSRLSGVGGTRGCDWWFTEEAVILDLAGRLFTHEGGASDEAEWEAFLELLGRYRPLCPANGIVLVLPCDSLLKDTEAQTNKKASRIQSALNTLIARLEARLPVYVVLTKADKVFGFAETVHRLEADKRFEMFGWSRSSERAEAPFDLGEIKQAFDGVVERARLLRAQMLATARIPEDLPAVDRLYAFPKELEALWPTLSAYLARVFSETALLDKLMFRGFYLTSGLQSGAPIAKVCSEIMGDVGEADRRSLDAIFTKQRAFFIKDLVRKRIFREKGLVQPTRKRTSRARRTAIFGYSAVGVLALLTIAGIWFKLFTRSATSDDTDPYRSAIEVFGRVDKLAETPEDLPAILTALTEVTQERDKVHEGAEALAFAELEPRWNAFLSAIVDHRLVPALRAHAEIAALQASDPKDSAEFEAQVETAEFLFGAIELSEDGPRKKLLDLAFDRDSAAKETCASFLQTRLASAGSVESAAGVSERLRALFAKMSARWDRRLEEGCPWQVGGPVGYLLAKKALAERCQDLENLSVGAGVSADTLNTKCAEFAAARKTFNESQGQLFPINDKWLVVQLFVDRDLELIRARRATFIARFEQLSSSQVGAQDAWPQAQSVQNVIAAIFDSEGKLLATTNLRLTAAEEKGIFDALAVGKLPETTKSLEHTAPPTSVQGDDDLARVCGEAFLALSAPTVPLTDIVKQLEDARGLLEQRGKLSNPRTDTALLKVVQAKCRAAAAEYRRRFGKPDELRAAVNSVGPRKFDARVSGHLGGMLECLTAIERSYAPDVKDWLAAVKDLQSRYESELVLDWQHDGARLDEIVQEYAEHKSQLAHGRPSELADARLGQHVKSGFQRAVVDRLLPMVAARRSFFGKVPPMRADQTNGTSAVAQWFLDHTTDGAIAVMLNDAAKLGEVPANLRSEDLDAAGSDALRQLGSLALGKPEGFDKYLEDLRQIARDLQIAANSGEANQLRDFSAKLRERRDKAQKVPECGAWTYVETLFAELERPIGKQREQLCVDGFRAVLGAHQSLLDALWAQPKDSAVDEGSAVATAAAELFRRDGVLDEFMRAHAISFDAAAAPATANSQLEPGGKWSLNDLRKLSVDNREYWDTLEFLLRVQAYLLAGDAESKGTRPTGSTSKLTFTMNDSDLRTVWKQPAAPGAPGREFFWAPVDDNLSLKQTAGSMFTVDWKFDGSPGQGLFFVWSNTAGRKDRPLEAASSDYVLRLRGTLAPLVLAWSGKPAEAGTEVQEWSVELPILELTKDLRNLGDAASFRAAPAKALFKLTFDRRVPTRPAKPTFLKK